MEIWKQIIINGEPYDYEVSSWGNIRNSKTGKLLKGNPIKSGYLRVCLRHRGKSKDFYIHRLVAFAFIPNPNNLLEVNHIDEVKTNNSVENLEWCTRKENVNHGTAMARKSAKLSEPVYYIDEDSGVAIVYPSIASTELDGYLKRRVSDCCNGKLKKHKGKAWKRVK